MSEREQLEQAIATLEAQRAVLGEAGTEAALAGLRQRLAALEDTEGQRPSPSSERRIITILFCDVTGSTALAEKLDPEEWTNIMKAAFEQLNEPVQRYGGTVARLMGDAVLAFFGAPAAHENDPRRAVLAGLGILENIAPFREKLNHERGLDFNVRVGINTGLAVVGEVGSKVHGEYTAMGDAVNLAARMEQTAQPGTIQISESTYKLVAPLFECQSLGTITVKGKSEPIQAYRVLAHKAAPGQMRGLTAHGVSSPLVGREAEFGTAHDAVSRLIKGEGGIVAIIGEAGIGKSRLVAELHQSLFDSNQSPVTWLEGQTLTYGQTISYWPFQVILRGWAAITGNEDEAEAWRKLESKVRALFGEETLDYLPYLASLLALDLHGDAINRVKYLDGEAMGKQIFLTSRRIFERLAQIQPTVLVFEDLQWMDESSTKLLEHLLPLIERVPLLIVGLARAERDTAAARLRELAAHDYPAHYTEIRLVPLSGPDSAQFVRNLLEIEDLSAHAHAAIVGKAEGNPFFIEEIIRTLIDSGAVKKGGSTGRWRASLQVETLTIPDTIHGVIMARIDRLDEDVKQVLRTAAVIGRSFFYRVLKAVTGADRTLDQSLAELQAIELIHEKQLLPELEYIFKHALVQEATYESILLQKRRELHTRVGQAIESLYAERLEEFYGLLAYHYAKAEIQEKAQEYLLKAGDQAGRIAADAEALNHYQQMMAAYASAFGENWNLVQQVALERKIGDAFRRCGEYPQAIEHYRQGLKCLGYQFPMSRKEVQRAMLGELVEQLGHRLLPRLFLKSVIEPPSPGTEDEAWIYSHMSLIYALTDSERYLMLTLRLLNHSERRGYPLGVVLGYFGLGVALDFMGVSGLARRYHRDAVHAAERLQLPVALGVALNGLQLHEDYRGELDQSLEHGQLCVQAAHEAGDLFALGTATALLAYASVHRGELADGLVHSSDAIRLGQDAGARDVWCWGETTQGYALRRLGRLQEAIAHQQKAIELAEAVPDYLYRIAAGAELGLCCLRQGDYDGALSQLEMCQRIAAEHHVIEPYGLVSTLNNLAEARLFAVEHSDALERATRLSKAEGACRAALKQAPKMRAKWPKAMRLRGTYEWLRGKPTAAQKWWQKSLAESQRMGLQYDVGMTHFEIGQRLGDRAHLEEAEAIFAEIGAELDLARAREYLQTIGAAVNRVRG